MTIPCAAYPLSALRAMALHAQGLTRRQAEDATPTRDAIHDAVVRLGGVQIDTLQMVSRSQYLALWSRLGDYDTSEFDTLASDPGDRRLFEYWYHAASLIPIDEFRFSLPAMRRFREGNTRYRMRWIEQPGNQELTEQTLAHVRDNGPVRAGDFESNRTRSTGWWDWKPAKSALEHLYNEGRVMIAGRVNFQRVYDIADRVLPEHIDTIEPTHEETVRHRLVRAMRALGVCEPLQIGDYTHMKRTESRAYIQQLIDDGTLVSIQGCMQDESVRELVVHRDDLDLLKQAADGEIAPSRTTFLSPFDSLFWANKRDQQLWGFQQILEAYKPAPQRIWGYFCLPILHNDRLIGRFDPKLERKEGVLRLKSIHIEPGVNPDEAMISDLADAMRRFMVFHNARDLVIERSVPADFGARLLAAL